MKISFQSGKWSPGTWKLMIALFFAAFLPSTSQAILSGDVQAWFYLWWWWWVFIHFLHRRTNGDKVLEIILDSCITYGEHDEVSWFSYSFFVLLFCFFFLQRYYNILQRHEVSTAFLAGCSVFLFEWMHSADGRFIVI